MSTKRAAKILEIMEEDTWYTVNEIYRKLPVEYKGGMHPKKSTATTCNRLVRLGRLKKKSGLAVDERNGAFYTKYYKRCEKGNA